MKSSGMLRRAALVRIDVSEYRSAYFIRVTRIGELGTTLAITSNRRTLRKQETDIEDLRRHILKRRYILEDGILQKSGSSVDIVTGLERMAVVRKISSFSPLLVCLRVPPTLSYNGYRSKSGHVVKLITCLYVVAS
jgi:hypothetical protein